MPCHLIHIVRGAVRVAAVCRLASTVHGLLEVSCPAPLMRNVGGMVAIIVPDFMPSRWCSAGQFAKLAFGQAQFVVSRRNPVCQNTHHFNGHFGKLLDEIKEVFLLDLQSVQ